MSSFPWLNFHHLRYFWAVAREGGLVAASQALNVSHPTLSTQVRALEEALGEKLFRKVGRRLELTEVGRVVYRYADEIFTLGNELVDTVSGVTSGKPLRLHVGVSELVPKLVLSQLLQPATELDDEVQIVCYEDGNDKLLAQLATHTLHVVISESPVPSGSPIRAHSHLLGQSGVSLFATPTLAATLGGEFPQCLDGAPMLMPLEFISVRRELERWFDGVAVRPRVVAEFQDSALLKAFGADGHGVFPAPSVVETQVVQRYGVEVLGRAEGVTESYYATSVERRLSHPAVVAISERARDDLFS